MSYGAWASRSSFGGQAARAVPAMQQVLVQLAEDFPPEAIAWVRDASWEGPEEVPLARVDFAGKAGWQATREPEKVALFRDRIARGWAKPIVLVRRPGMPRDLVTDGHHRALAYEALGESVLAYVGTVGQDRGPWDVMHEKQRTTFEGSSTARSPSPGSNLRP